MTKQQFHTGFGVAMLVLGLYGVYDQLYNVIDFATGVVNVVLLLLGLIILVSGVLKGGMSKVVAGVGCVLAVIGLYGLYDEWSATVDVFRGLSPLVLILFGVVSLVSGIRVLNSRMA